MRVTSDSGIQTVTRADAVDVRSGLPEFAFCARFADVEPQWRRPSLARCSQRQRATAAGWTAAMGCAAHRQTSRDVIVSGRPRYCGSLWELRWNSASGLTSTVMSPSAVCRIAIMVAWRSVSLSLGSFARLGIVRQP